MFKRLNRVSRVSDEYDVSKASINRMVKKGEFPPPITIPAMPGAAFWTDEQLETWAAEQIANSKPRIRQIDSAQKKPGEKAGTTPESIEHGQPKKTAAG